MSKIKIISFKYFAKIYFLLVFLLLIHDTLSCQVRCQNDSDGIAFSTFGFEKGPKSNLSSKELIVNINKNIKRDIFPLSYGEEFFITFIINCKAEDFNYQFLAMKDGKIFTDSISSFQEIFINYLDSTVIWTAGQSNTSSKGLVPWRFVDYTVTLRFLAKKKKFKLLDKFE